MNGPRAFSATAPDERATTLLGIISTVVALQRHNLVWPKLIVMNTEVYKIINEYFGGDDTIRLFNVDVLVDCSEEAIPFVVISEARNS